MSHKMEQGSSTEESGFTRGQTYRSLRSIATFQPKKDKIKVIPSAVSISPHGKQGKRGFLWRLSTKRLVYTPEWKRKYCVLSGGGYLYYYESETSQGGDRGSGVIDLRCVMDCVEAPLTDHKKATNVFILIATQRGFFNQGRHYLSAETLFDMKDWVKQIKAVLTNLVEPNRTAVNTHKVASILEHHSTTVPEPLYASIKEESIHRSNSMSTLPSLCRGDQGEADYLNRSMDDCPMLGLGHTDHNHTYSYSSSDDSLNESFTINFNQKSPRFAEAPTTRKPIKNKPTLSVNYEYDDIKSLKSANYESIKSPPLYARPVLRHSTPTKAVDTSDYIKQMYEDMERVDKQLEMVAKIETDRQSNASKMGDSEGSVNTVVSYVDDGAEVDGAEKLEKIEAVMTKLNEESEKITQMLSQIQNTTSTNLKAGGDLQAKLDNSKLLEMVGNYQKAVTEIQSQAMEMLLEIQSTQAKVVRSLNDPEEAKHSFLSLKKEAEHLRSQLQDQQQKLQIKDGLEDIPFLTIKKSSSDYRDNSMWTENSASKSTVNRVETPLQTWDTSHEMENVEKLCEDIVIGIIEDCCTGYSRSTSDSVTNQTENVIVGKTVDASSESRLWEIGGDSGDIKGAGKWEPGNQIQNQYKELLGVLYGKEYILDENLSHDDIDNLKANWSVLIELLLHTFSTSLIDLAIRCSYYNTISKLKDEHSNKDELVYTSLKIITSFAKMQVLSLDEVKYSFTHIGIMSIPKIIDDLNTTSEAVFCLTLDKERYRDIQVEAVQNAINDVLQSPSKLQWLGDQLNHKGDLAKHFEKVEIKVTGIFPGSTKVIVKMKYLDFPEDPKEINNMIQIVRTLLGSITAVSKTCGDESKRMNRNDGVLRMKIQIGKKYLPRNDQEKLKTFLSNFVEEMRKSSVNKSFVEKKLKKKGIAPESIDRFYEQLYKPDKIVFDLEPIQNLDVDTMRLTNIPLWPSDKIKLEELADADRQLITNLFANNFGKEIWDDIVQNFDILNNEEVFAELQKEIGILDKNASRYRPILLKYKKRGGTIGGVLECLQKCKSTKNITKNQKTETMSIDDITEEIIKLKERHFSEWVKKYPGFNRIPGFIASYEDFKKAADNSKSTRCVLRGNITEWGETMENVIKEGDQIWMWRENKLKPSYSHVGIFIGEGMMVHVSRKGLNGVIRTDPIETVIKTSKCFIVKPDPKKVQLMSGTPKARALACVGLEFTYSVTTGTCEVFANCICLGIWDIECACIQGDEHPHVDNILTGVYGLFHWDGYKKQQKDLQQKLAKKLQQDGFVDEDILQIIKASVSDIIPQDGIQECLQREAEKKRYFCINVWEILEGISIEDCGLGSGWSSEDTGRLCVVEKPENDTSFQSHLKDLFNTLPKDLRNMRHERFSIKDFVKNMDEQFRFVPEEPCPDHSGTLDSLTTTTSSNSDTTSAAATHILGSFRRFFDRR